MRRVAGALAALALVAGACGGTASSGADAGRTIQIEMREFSYSPAKLTLTPGEKVTLSFKNTGAVEHEFMAGTNGTGGKGYAQDWLAGAATGSTGDHGGAGHAGEGIRIGPGKSGTLRITVPAKAEELEFGCFVAGHYEAGMKGTITVR